MHIHARVHLYIRTYTRTVVQPQIKPPHASTLVTRHRAYTAFETSRVVQSAVKVRTYVCMYVRIDFFGIKTRRKEHDFFQVESWCLTYANRGHSGKVAIAVSQWATGAAAS